MSASLRICTTGSRSAPSLQHFLTVDQWGEPEQIVLRQFEPELALEYEFRGFVYRGKLNAISQCVSL